MIEPNREERLACALHGAALLYARGAHRVWLFGSLGAAGTTDVHSDVDLAVEGLAPHGFAAAAAELARRLSCPVDLVDADRAPPNLRALVRRGRVVARDEAGTVPRQPSAPAAQTLYGHRLAAVAGTLAAAGARSVVDLGCGSAWLLEVLAREGRCRRLLGIDLAADELEAARVRMARTLAPHAQRRVELGVGLVTHRDARLRGFDAAVAMEVVEHLAPEQLAAFASVVFGFARPPLVLVTTPNREYNAMWRVRTRNGLRHPDHRFEWTRPEFAAWAKAVAAAHRYAATVVPVGPVDKRLGAPTQMAVLRAVD